MCIKAELLAQFDFFRSKERPLKCHWSYANVRSRKVKHRGPFWKCYCYKVNKVLISETNLPIKFVYGHTMLKTPVLHLVFPTNQVEKDILWLLSNFVEFVWQERRLKIEFWTGTIWRWLWNSSFKKWYWLIEHYWLWLQICFCETDAS